MQGTPANLEQQLAELNQQYLRRLQQEIPQLQWLLLQFIQAGPLEWREQAAVLVLRFHTLAGSAGTFGLARVGTVAKSIEKQVKALLSQQQVPESARTRAAAAVFCRNAAGRRPANRATFQ